MRTSQIKLYLHFIGHTECFCMPLLEPSLVIVAAQYYRTAAMLHPTGGTAHLQR